MLFSRRILRRSWKVTQLSQFGHSFVHLRRLMSDQTSDLGLNSQSREDRLPLQLPQTPFPSAEASVSTFEASGPQESGPEEKSSVSKKMKRWELEEMLRLKLDPERKMTKKEWKRARADYEENMPPEEVAIWKGTKYYENVVLAAAAGTGEDADNIGTVPLRGRKAHQHQQQQSKQRHQQQQRVQSNDDDDGTMIDETNNNTGSVNPAVLNLTEYYFKDGKRYVWPYSYTFASYIKGRWIGRTLKEIIFEEFAAFDDVYFDNALKNGKLTRTYSRVICMLITPTASFFPCSHRTIFSSLVSSVH